jgi:DNA-binding MarR family transcriptional regulator
MSERRPEEQAARAAEEGRSCIALRARRLSRLVTKLFEDALRGHEITVAQFTLLGATILAGPLQPARLARMLDLEKSTLSRNLRLLEAAGLVRIGSAEDGAGQRVAATERGRRALVAALPAWREAQSRAVAALGDVVVGRLDGMIAALGARAEGAQRDGPRVPASRRVRR